MYVNYLPWDVSPSVSFLPLLLPMKLTTENHQQLQAMFDCAFARGRNVLIRVALAILDINRSRILAINDAASLLGFLKDTSNLHFEGALEVGIDRVGISNSC